MTPSDSEGDARATATKPTQWTKPLLACLLIIAIILAGVSVYQQNQMSGLSSTTTQQSTARPVAVVSVVGPVPPITPGGPSITITLENTSTSPITSLTASLSLDVPYDYTFDVTESAPLVPGQSASQTTAQIRGGFQGGASYPLSIEGTLQNGTTFAYSEEVQIVSPTTVTSVQTTTETTFITGGPYNGLMFISASCVAEGGGTAVPCWGNTNPYLFTFSSSCASSEGCNQTVGAEPFPSVSKYTVNLRFLFTNQTTPIQQNCVWTVIGTTQQGYAYCVMVNPTSFWVGMQGPPPP